MTSGVIQQWKDFEKRLQDWMYKWVSLYQPFVQTVLQEENVTTKCTNDVHLLLEDLKELKTWAFEMLDSTGKPPGGLLEGTVTAFGSFDQCINIKKEKDDSQLLRGQYCSVHLRPPLPPRNRYASVVKPLDVFKNISSKDNLLSPSGLLTSYLMTKLMKNSGNKLNIPLYIFHRYMRLTPPMVLLIGLVYLTPLFGSGPVWHEIIDQKVTGCRKYWWINLLYLQNYIRAEPKCVEHTWYIGNDMTFHLVSLIVLIPLLKAELEFENAVYFNPLNHLASYCIGMTVGYLIYMRQAKPLNKTKIIIGWVVSLTFLCGVLGGLYDHLAGYSELSRLKTVFYAALHRPIWTVGVAWVMFVCCTGNGGVINAFLSWKGFIPLSRMTYMTYLTHLWILWLYIGNLRERVYSGHLITICTYLGSMVMSFTFSFVCVLFVEAPFMNLEKMIISSYLGKCSNEGKEIKKTTKSFNNFQESRQKS
ncbi:nose resistant to fluoxetine protein 6-like [Limulus polyphemus]|uniref:Nose resistant to fluoxetine protein 6-like n=1 Tax=Limulus polyphemus TaxID=6850 RepID=A0ABM1TDM8_LIMPO|nr:nose resistant to fluoxetine protein 6-like [Limulus polyphemus]